MEKSLITMLMDRLQASVPRLRWIDLEDGQLNIAERPPLAYPACLIDMSYPLTKTFPDGNRQSVVVEIKLALVFQSTGATSAAAPKSLRPQALERFDILNDVHACLQGWDGGRLFVSPCSRVRVMPRGTRGDGLKVYDAIYQLTHIDAPSRHTNEG